MTHYDVIIIGAGPGGYVCAIRCAQLGLKTAVVEGRETLGGTCLNVGCIPSKALLHASHSLHEAEHNFAKMGLIGKAPSVDWDAMKAYKDETITQNTGGIEFLFKKNKIDWIKGWAKLIGDDKIRVDDKEYSAKHIIIATGSAPSTIPNVTIDEKRIVSSTGALSLSKIPKTMTIIGAGVIGLELGSVYARLGTKVTVIEYQDRITPEMDSEIAKTFQKLLSKQGINFIMGAAVQAVQAIKTKTKTTYQQGDKTAELSAEITLVATGRQPFHDGLGFADLGGELTQHSQIATDAQGRTNLAGIYAIGDVSDGPMLAHKAEDEGIALAETLAGKHGHINYDLIPNVIVTSPGVASVGQTEDQLNAAGGGYKVGKFSFMGNGRAKSVFQGDGMVKMLADTKTDRILGCHLIGPAAGELIHEICVAMEFGAAAQDIALTCHAHPTFSEAIREAAFACGDGAIHA